jgi:Rrf2 family protein
LFEAKIKIIRIKRPLYLFIDNFVEILILVWFYVSLKVQIKFYKMLAKSTEYAIRALVYIEIQNQEGLRPGVKQIAREISSPEAYTGKIMQILTKQGLVRSMKGRGGGFFFDKSTRPLTLQKIIRVMEGEAYFNKCGLGFNGCDSHAPCPIHHEYIAVKEELFDLFEKQTIEGLAKNVQDGGAVLFRTEL